MIGGLLPCSTGGAVRPCQPLMRLVFPGEPLAVREALHRVMEGLSPLDMAAEDRSAIEIVLAEVLNNIAEHAYDMADPGLIELVISHAPEAVCIELADNGRPYPGDSLPEGKPAVIGHSLERLPEGGFGWFLIRAMADNLTYRREEGCNHLGFRMRLGRGAARNQAASAAPRAPVTKSPQ